MTYPENAQVLKVGSNHYFASKAEIESNKSFWFSCHPIKGKPFVASSKKVSANKHVATIDGPVNALLSQSDEGRVYYKEYLVPLQPFPVEKSITLQSTHFFGVELKRKKLISKYEAEQQADGSFVLELPVQEPMEIVLCQSRSDVLVVEAR